ncbi:MAG TPA: nuclear transport factor 2 family protein [Polyangiaceae bacterium]|nr:nuclear transport factor 2 family protein [Polyangiaceae bacterium]
MSESSVPVSRAEARRFAEAWAHAWNRRDVEAVLSHFADDVVFESPKAVAITGSARVEGKSALRAYWQGALHHITSLQFDVDDVVLDAEARSVIILYCSCINGNAQRVAEHLQFGADGRVRAGAAYYGIAPAAA